MTKSEIRTLIQQAKGHWDWMDDDECELYAGCKTLGMIAYLEEHTLTRYKLAGGRWLVEVYNDDLDPVGSTYTGPVGRA